MIFAKIVPLAFLFSCGVSKVKSGANGNCPKGNTSDKSATSNTSGLQKNALSLTANSDVLKFENIDFVGGTVSAKVYNGEDWSVKSWPNFSVSTETSHCSALFQVKKSSNGYSVVAHSTDNCMDNVAVRGKEIELQIFGKSDKSDSYGYEKFAVTSELASRAEEFLKGVNGVGENLRGEYIASLFTTPMLALSTRFPQFYAKKEALTEAEELKLGKDYCSTFGDTSFTIVQKRDKCFTGFSTRYFNFSLSKEQAKGKEDFLNSIAEKSQKAYANARAKFSQSNNSAEVEAALNYDINFLVWENALRDSMISRFLETLVGTTCPIAANALSSATPLAQEICAIGKKRALEIGKPFFINSEIDTAVAKLISTNFDTSSVASVVALREKYKKLRVSTALSYLESIKQTHKLIAENLNSLAIGTNYAFKKADGKVALYFDVKKLPLKAGGHLGSLFFESKDGLIWENEGSTPDSAYQTQFTSGKVLFLNGFPLWGAQTIEKQNGGAALLPLPARNGGASGSQIPSAGSDKTCS